MTANTLTEVESDTVVFHYMYCALWSSLDDDGNPLDADHDNDDFTAETAVKMANDCFRFLLEVKAAGLLDAETPEQIGHDFWLTRNGHGAGFWDRGLGEAGERLTAIAKTFPAVALFEAEGGRIICE